MRVVITDYMQPDIALERRLLDAAGLTLLRESQACTSEAAAIELAQGADVMIAQSAPLTRRVFAALPDLRLVSLPQIGSDCVDLEAARDHGIWVAHVPDGNITEVACHALAMVLALVRQLPAFDRSMRAGAWDYEVAGGLLRPGTMTLGIVGMGRIGRLLAGYGAPVFGRVMGHDPFVPEAAWPRGVIRAATLDELCEQAHVVSLHMPLTDQTQGLMDAAFLAALRPGAYLVNVSRGPIVDTTALLAALDSGHLGGAALDVFPQEPPDPADPLLAHPKIILSPHAAFYSLQSDEELRRRSVETITAFRDEGRPRDVIVEGSR